MQYKNGTLSFSASDLTVYLDSPFASWMDRYALESPSIDIEPDEIDSMVQLLFDKGYKHEEQVETELRQEADSYIRIDGADEAEKIANTRSAMASGVGLITQACLQLGEFFGYADFLVKVEGKSDLGDHHYQVWDAKLSKTAKPSHALQLCLYADMLEEIQGTRPKEVVVVLGSGERHAIPLSECFAYYQTVRDDFLAFHAAFDPDRMPDPADFKSWGRWSGYAKEALLARDHLFQVAGITRDQITKLNRVGVETMSELAATDIEKVSGIGQPVYERLKAQAAIQCESSGREIPAYRLLTPAPGERKGLALLPPHSDLDVFFDIEGYPLDDGGLEYLWGCTYFEAPGKRAFRDFWAHDSEEEKRAFKAFIEWVYARWLDDPAMHIYHYASYEITACRKLMNRYGICEHEVDQLLRNEVFVDLYKVVKGGLLLGEPRYSIKNVEHLYRGKRDTDVASGGESVVVYELWREKHARGEEGGTWETSEILNSIRDYNIDDCDSTQELVDWLRARQAEAGIAFLGKPRGEEPEVKEDVTTMRELRDRLLRKADALRPEEPDEAALTENLAWMLEFHHREAKPNYWRVFDRMGQEHDELEDDLECLANCYRTDREAFKHSPRARNLCYEYHFDPAQELKTLPEAAFLHGEYQEDGKLKKVAVRKEESDLEQGLVVLQSKEEPRAHVSLIPDQNVSAKPIPGAIADVVGGLEIAPGKRSPILDFLRRERPRVLGHEAGNPLVTASKPEERLTQIIDVVKRLDGSYLPIQGPPGTGKSFTAKHVITELIRCGFKVGITSNSHKAINHLMKVTAECCKAGSVAAKFSCAKDKDGELAALGIEACSNTDLAANIEDGYTVGTTAWGFCRDDVVESLDYLFVDEAGQVATPNLVGMSRSAKNIVLMGDQMQLGQPSQGVHPGDSGLSVLDYLMRDTPTISPDRGVFLGTTFRMHENVNHFVSEQVYEGKLGAHPSTAERYLRLKNSGQFSLRESGIVYIPVEHQGNSQASEEEVGVINALVSDLVSNELVLPSGIRQISMDDILFVAPYNHQVRKLQESLGSGAKVGSVDKFQGQEAPIVVLSLCSSDADESPRGIEFLFDRQRLNVAVSRAECLVIVVGSPSLIRCQAKRFSDLRRLNMVSALYRSGASGV